VGKISNKEYQSLEIDIRHLDLLIDVLLSKISIDTYLKNYYIMSPPSEEYGNACGYPPGILTLENNKKSCVHVSDDVHNFIEVLAVCSGNIKKYICNRNYEAIKEEIYYNHNVPSLIESNIKELIEYYLDIECKGFKARFSMEAIQPYLDIWEKIRLQLGG